MNEVTIKLTDEAINLLEKLATTEKTTVEKMVGSIVENFFATGG